VFFFENKNQNTFALARLSPAAANVLLKRRQAQYKLFQKRRRSLLRPITVLGEMPADAAGSTT
jgi:hypothetical protein